MKLLNPEKERIFAIFLFPVLCLWSLQYLIPPENIYCHLFFVNPIHPYFELLSQHIHFGFAFRIYLCFFPHSHSNHDCLSSTILRIILKSCHLQHIPITPNKASFHFWWYNLLSCSFVRPNLIHIKNNVYFLFQWLLLVWLISKSIAVVCQLSDASIVVRASKKCSPAIKSYRLRYQINACSQNYWSGGILFAFAKVGNTVALCVPSTASDPTSVAVIKSPVVRIWWRLNFGNSFPKISSFFIKR